MSVVWTITAGALEKSLLSWGIADARLTLRNLDTDELTFRTPTANIFADPIFNDGDAIILKADGVTRFRGVITKLPAAGSRKREEQQYVASGPWWQLASTVYQQARMIQNADFTALASEDTTRVILGQNDLGARITTGTQIAAVIAYALTQGVPIVAGTTPAFITAPLDECRDITCAEAIRRQLANTPDAVGWFDYSSAVPTFNVQRRDLLSAQSIDLGDTDRVENFSVTPRPDLVPPGVVFIYVTTEVNGESTWTRITRDTAGALSGVGVITATIEMMGAGTDNQEAPPTGFALEYYASLQPLQWEGSVGIHEVDCGGDFRPGKVLNLAGGRAAWATMRAVIQIVTQELERGITTIDFGPPDHLSPQDFVNQLLFNRKVARPPESTNFATTKPPKKDDGTTTNTNAGKDPKSYTDSQTSTGTSTTYATRPITVCEDGAETVISVLTPSTL
jgi:hypothetical protein